MFSLKVTREIRQGEDGFHVEAEAKGPNIELFEEMAVGCLNLIRHMSGDFDRNVCGFIESIAKEIIY